MPRRLRKVLKVLERHGVTGEFGTKHYQLRREGLRPYTLPAHNGLNSEIGDDYLRRLCAHFGIDRGEFGL